jgi:hypothetical protein
VPAYVVESPQDVIISADDDDRFSRHIRRKKLSPHFYLLHTSDHLPGFAEDRIPFEFGDAGIYVPWRWDG